jgi:hypothetical protein
MKRLVPILILILSLVEWSCVRNVEIDIRAGRKVVVYGLLEANKEPRIYLYKSLPFELDLSVRPLEFIRDAQVFLISGDEKIPLRPQQAFEKTIFRGLYQPDDVIQDSVPVTFWTAPIVIQSGQNYELEVFVNDDKIKASTTVPKVIDFKKTRIVKDTTRDDEGNQVIRDLLELIFDDDSSAVNFYKYTVDYQQEAVVQGEEGPLTIRVNYSFLLPTFISDEGKNGRSFRIRFLVSDKVNTFQNPDYIFNLQTTLISYDPRLIEFNRSLIRQGDDDFIVLDPFREPVIIKSNIEGGLGIFSSMAQSPVRIVQYQPGF